MSTAKPTPLITPADGARLMSSSSHDTVGVTNYVEKVNFRRDGDVEMRREGWTLFRPNAGVAITNQPLNLSGGQKITLLAENVRPNSDRCVVAASKTTIYRFDYTTGTWLTIGTGFSASGKRWQVVVIEGWIVFNNAVDLPVSYRVEDNAVVPLKELRENGIASVGWIAEYNGFMMCLNVVEIKATELNGVMNGSTPYGRVTADKTNAIPNRVIWPEFGQPINWAPVFKVTQGASSATITLPFPSSIFVAGVTRVAVINGGANGDTLGGDSAHPDGILVSSVVGSVITLEIPTTAGLSYPREIEITRWTDISTLSAYKDLKGGHHLTCGAKIGTQFALYHKRGIYNARYTADPGAPFEWREREPDCVDVPQWPEALVSVGGGYHLYPGKDQFYQYDGAGAPSPHPVLNACKDQLFNGLTATSAVWAVHNPLTKEAWFCRPSKTICFDYATRGGGTVSTMNVELDAAALVTKPSWEDDWFILSHGGVVYTYARINGAVTTFLRNGSNPGGKLKWGKTAFGDTFSEKLLETYQLQLASGQQAIGLYAIIYGSYSASAAQETLLTELIGNAGEDGAVIPCHFLATYFQDEVFINGDDTVDRDVRFIGRLFDRKAVRTRGTGRNDA